MSADTFDTHAALDTATRERMTSALTAWKSPARRASVRARRSIGCRIAAAAAKAAGLGDGFSAHSGGASV